MSPLNRGSLMGPRVPAGVPRPLLPRFAGRHPAGMPPRMPPPINPMFGPMRQRLPMPPRPGIPRAGGPPPPPPPLMFNPRGRGMPPPGPQLGMRAPPPRGPLMRPWSVPHPGPTRMRPRYTGNGNVKGKGVNNKKIVNKLEELELKKPWMTDEIRSEIQKKNKLYAKAKKNKDAKEWEEFKDLRNKVTRMIRDAKNEYLAKHPDQAQLYASDDEPYDQRDENYSSSEDETVFYCEVCDRNFPTADDLTSHKETHKRCGIDGCNFSAHPSLVEKHIRMQHSTGLYQRLKDFTSPEDIDKWIAERKKKYPTRANVELKKLEELKKQQRGEIIKEKCTKLKKRRPARNEKKRKSHKRRKTSSCAIMTETYETYRGLQPFAGTLNIKGDLEEPTSEDHLEESCDETAIAISDEEDLSLCQTVDTFKIAVTECAIPRTNPFSLVANYSSDSEDDPPVEEPVTIIKSCIEENVPQKPNENEENTKKICDPELHRSKPTNNVPIKNRERKMKVSEQYNSKKEHYDIGNQKSYNSKQLQLLEKLLSRSIQHERNVICQCMKYIVDNNFFDIS